MAEWFSSPWAAGALGALLGILAYRRLYQWLYSTPPPSAALPPPATPAPPSPSPSSPSSSSSSPAPPPSEPAPVRRKSGGSLKKRRLDGDARGAAAASDPKPAVAPIALPAPVPRARAAAAAVPRPTSKSEFDSKSETGSESKSKSGPAPPPDERVEIADGFVFALFDATAAQSSAAADSLAPAVMQIAVMDHRERELIVALVRAELRSHLAGDGATLFRANNLATKAMRVWVADDVDAYLVRVLRPAFARLAKDALPDSLAYELDPQRLSGDAAAAAKKALGRVLKIADVLLAPLLDLSRNAPPPRFRALTSWVYEALEGEDMSAPQRRQLVASLFFLRFLGPALMAPYTKQLVDSPATVFGQRGVTYVSKCVQILSNEALAATPKEPFLAPALEQMRPRYAAGVTAFIDGLCAPFIASDRSALSPDRPVDPRGRAELESALRLAVTRVP